MKTFNVEKVKMNLPTDSRSRQIYVKLDEEKQLFEQLSKMDYRLTYQETLSNVICVDLEKKVAFGGIRVGILACLSSVNGKVLSYRQFLELLEDSNR